MQTAEINSIETALRELAPLVTEVQRTLESGLDEGGSGTDAVMQVIRPLANIRGTLDLIELHGAALLVREMGELAAGVADGRVAESESALEVLLEGVFKLPDYLDRIRSGQRDAPTVLLPLINRLRVLRGESELPESDLFLPPLPAFDPDAEANGQLQMVAQRVRGQFQRALLGWYRGSEPEEHLRGLGNAVQELADASAGTGAQQLWEASGAFLDSLIDDPTDPEGNVKTLLARIERMLSALARDGASALRGDEPANLLRELLYRIARSSSDRPAVLAVRQSRQLDRFLPDSGAVAEFEGPTRELLGAVGEGIRSDIAHIKDAVEIYVHSDERRPGILDGLPERLKQVADTFSMLGLAEDQATLRASAETLAGVEELEEGEAEQCLQALADELLRAESNLARLQGGSRAQSPQEEEPGWSSLGIRVLPDSEFWPLVTAVVTACLDDLSKLREAVGVYCSDPEADRETLFEVPALLAEVEGAINMLPLERATPLVRDLRAYVQRELVEAGRRPDDDTQVLIADVVAGLEYYLEAVAHDRAGMTHLLEGAVRAMYALQSGGAAQIYDEDETVVLEAPVEEQATPDTDVVATEEEATPSPDDSWQEANDEPAAADDAAAVSDADFDLSAFDLGGDDFDDVDFDLAEGEPAASGDAEDSAAEAGAAQPATEEASSIEAAPAPSAQDEEVETDELARDSGDEASAEEPDPEPASPAETAAPAAGVDPDASGSRFAIVGDDVDEDVVEVYIEEALGELDKINEHLPRWKANTADEEAVIVIRRAYHTLKGGGRLIGAELLGEFSWAMENLLNRIIDRSVAPSPPVFETLEEASAALPQLVEQIQGNRAPIEGVDDLVARAHALSRGEELPQSAAVSATQSSPEPAPAAGPAEDEPVDTVEADSAEAGFDEIDFAEQEEPAPADSEQPGGGEHEPAFDAEAVADDPDRTLLQIFEREAEGHQSVLRQAFGAPGGEAIQITLNNDIDRAVHTLLGSAQTAGVEAIAALAGEMEDIERTRREQRGLLEPDEVELFREAIARIDEVLADLPEMGRVDVSDLHERLAAHNQQVAAAVQANAEEGDSELLEVFLGEGDELLEDCDRAVGLWREQPDAHQPLKDLQRSLHTLKGGARMANLMPIADLTHEFESAINAVEAAGAEPDEFAFELMQETVDALTILLEQARAQQPIARVDWLVADLQTLYDHATVVEPSSGADTATAPTQESAVQSASAETPAAEASPGAPDASAGESDTAEPGSYDTAPASEAATAEPVTDEDTTSVTAASKGGEREEAATVSAAPGAAQPGSDQVRVQSDVLDNLVNFAGEVSIYHSRLNEQMGQYRFNLAEFQQTVSRLRSQLRTMEDETESQILYRNQPASGEVGDGSAADPDDFDPLEFDRYTRLQELSRSLSESVGDLDSLKEIMDTITRDAETLLLQQSRVSSELQDGLMQTRMVRFDGLRARLARIVRQTASQLGKKAQLTLTGGELELDRSVQERIVAPLEHTLRNAVAHGIEMPQERARHGKAEQGSVQLDLHRGGTDVVIEIIDDGAGIDPAAVRKRAIERGLIEANDGRDDNELIKLILETGFSTADEVTQIAGRGVGMDVVDSEIRRLGGTLGIQTQVGAGTRFTIRLPVTLAINQAVLVKAGDETYAIPIASVEGVAQVTAGDLKPYYIDSSQPFVYANTEYRLQHLGRLLGTSEPRLHNADATYPVIMVRAGDERVAIQVEELVGRRDVVVKPLGAPLNELPALGGATIMPDGKVVLILEIGGLLRTENRFVATGRSEDATEGASASAESTAPAASGPTVLVVDDSITIRKVTQRILERHEINVVTAKDGIDAVSWMAQSVPDLILLDIEMPRMDGYEVASYVRGDERLSGVPIIMITSRTGEKHRERAEEIGVNRYLGKPYQETELMENISELLQARETA